jgi:hypothetical protein
MSDQEIIKRPGCFVGDKTDPNSLCHDTDCPLVRWCLCKKKEIPRGLGLDYNKIEGMTRTSIQG